MDATNGAIGGGATAHVLDAPEKLEDAPRRLARVARAPFNRAKDWKTFASVRFSCPSSAQDALSRVRKNARDYSYNYLCIALVIVAWSALSRLWAVALCAGAFAGHHYVARVRKMPLEIGGKVLSVQTQSLALTVIFVVVLYPFIVDIVLASALFGLIFFGAHATMRIPDAKSDEDDGEIPLLRDVSEICRDNGVSFAPVISGFKSLIASFRK